MTKNVTIIVGGQYGSEAKGKVEVISKLLKVEIYEGDRDVFTGI